MKQLISDLLAYSRVSNSKRQLTTIDSNECFEDAVFNLQTVIEESHAIVQSAELPAIQGDHFQMTQLLQNLIGNGLKYHDGHAPRIDLRVEPREDQWLFCVEDNGIGIAIDSRERIFSPFQRLHTCDEYSGTGIGLGICKRIVERFGGTIWVESEVGVGSEFCFALPKVAV